MSLFYLLILGSLERDFEDSGSKDDEKKPKSSAKPVSVKIPDSELVPQVQVRAPALASFLII